MNGGTPLPPTPVGAHPYIRPTYMPPALEFLHSYPGPPKMLPPNESRYEREYEEGEWDDDLEDDEDEDEEDDMFDEDEFEEFEE